MTSSTVKSKIATSVKAAFKKSETKEKHKAALTKAYQNPEYHKKLSIASKAYHASEKHQEFIIAMNKPETKEKQSKAQLKRFQNKELHEAFIQTMNKPETKEKLRNRMRSYETQKKINDTKRANGSLNSSKEEDRAYQDLSKVFDVVKRQYYCTQYPYKCDFYLPKQNLFIECHFSWLHNNKAFDKNNLEHLKEAENIKDKEQKLLSERVDKENMYTVQLYTWTDLDVRKRQCAIDNKLNWIAFYSYNDFKVWLDNYLIRD